LLPSPSLQSLLHFNLGFNKNIMFVYLVVLDPLPSLALACARQEWFEPPVGPILPLLRRQLDGYTFR
jgi:hypothetical protein